MDYQAIFARIRQTVDTKAYFTSASAVGGAQRDAIGEVRSLVQASDFDVAAVRSFIAVAEAEGRIDRVMALSALHVVACHPAVQDWECAARLVGEQEFAALELGGPNLQDNLASVDRHRGVLAYLRGHYEVALDYFARALERQRSADNLQNILCTLIRLGDEDDAQDLVARIRRTLPAELVAVVNHAILHDPDLALLRRED